MTIRTGEGERERLARRRYLAALAAASESLRRAEQLIAESSALIDAHIRSAWAAIPGRGIVAPERGGRTAPAAVRGSTLSPGRLEALLDEPAG